MPRESSASSLPERGRVAREARRVGGTAPVEPTAERSHDDHLRVRRPVRRLRLRDAAVPALGRAVGDARDDELRQPGALHVRDDRRLRHGHAYELVRLAVSRHPPARVRGGGARERRVRAHHVPPPLPCERPRPVPADDRARVCLGRGGGLVLRHDPAAREPAPLPARLLHRHGGDTRCVPAFPDRHVARRHADPRADARVHALRRAGARRGRQPAHGARARHQRRRRVRDHVRARQRPRGAGRRARDRHRRPRPLVRPRLPGVRPDRGVGRRARFDRRLVRRRDAPRHQRHGRQVLLPGDRLVPDLPGDGRPPDVAARRPVREALVSTEAAAGPPHYPPTQIRWRPIEVVFWLAMLLPFLVTPNYLVLASQIAITALFALSLDLILGYAGIVSLGHAAFFGLGAYAAGLTAKHGWGEPLSGLLCAAVVAGLVGYAASFVIARFRHLALIMITLGMGLLLHEAANSASWLTGGADGLQGVRVWRLLGAFRFDLYGYTAYAYSLAVLFLALLGTRRLIHSPFGLSLRGIRENRLRMPAIGAPSRAHI